MRANSARSAGVHLGLAASLRYALASFRRTSTGSVYILGVLGMVKPYLSFRRCHACGLWVRRRYGVQIPAGHILAVISSFGVNGAPV